MIVLWLAIVAFGHLVRGRSIFDDLPPIVSDQAPLADSQPSTHQFLFNPIGKYATDVHYCHIRIPIDFKPIMENFAHVHANLNNIVKTTKDKVTFEVIRHVAIETNQQVQIIQDNFSDLLQNLPKNGITEYHRKKRFLGIIFGIAGTAFGVANSIAINNINSLIAKEITRTDLLVDITQLHSNHLHNIDTQLQNVDTIIREFISFNPSLVVASSQTMMAHLLDVQLKVSNAVSQAQLHRLSALTFSHKVLQSIKNYIDDLAADKNYISFVTHISDLYQLEASFVYNPTNLTFNIILHVPLVKPEYLLTLNQYVPFPLSQDFASNHSITPDVGYNDVLAFGHMNTFKIISQSDLAGCHRMGDTYFCKGRNVLQTKMEETCLGAIFRQNLGGVKTYCKFEVKPLKEQVFQLATNKWQIFSMNRFTTTKVCETVASPLAIGYSTTIELEPGCKVLLQANILYAEHESAITIEPTHYTWTWNITAIFPDIPSDKFSTALQSLHDYGLHVVEASDIVHHLKFNNFEGSIPNSISNLISNPFNYVIGLIAIVVIGAIAYFVIQRFCKAKPRGPSDFPMVPVPPGTSLYPTPSAPTLAYQFIYPQL